MNLKDMSYGTRDGLYMAVHSPITGEDMLDSVPIAENSDRLWNEGEVFHVFEEVVIKNGKYIKPFDGMVRLRSLYKPRFLRIIPYNGEEKNPKKISIQLFDQCFARIDRDKAKKLSRSLIGKIFFREPIKHKLKFISR